MQESDVVDWFDHETLSPSGVAIGFTSSKIVPAGNVPSASRAKCTVETQSIRYWEDGGTPTTTEGILVAAGGTFTVYGRDSVKKCRIIAVTGSPKVQCEFGR
jgi:hypothetical protein